MRYQGKESQGFTASRNYEETRKGSSLQLLEGALILDFCPPEMWEIKFLLFEAIQFMVICHDILGSLKKKNEQVRKRKHITDTGSEKEDITT